MCDKKIADYARLPVLDTDTVDGKIMSLFQHKYKGNPQEAFVGVLGLQQKYKASISTILTVFHEYMDKFKICFVDRDTGCCVRDERFYEVASKAGWPGKDVWDRVGKLRAASPRTNGGKVMTIATAIEAKLMQLNEEKRA